MHVSSECRQSPGQKLWAFVIKEKNHKKWYNEDIKIKAVFLK